MAKTKNWQPSLGAICTVRALDGRWSVWTRGPEQSSWWLKPSDETARTLIAEGKVHSISGCILRNRKDIEHARITPEGYAPESNREHSTRMASEARRLKDEGQSKADSAERKAWIDAADKAIADLAARGAEFTAEDVRAVVGDPTHANAMGGRFSAAARRGLIRSVDTATSARPERHTSLVRVWVGA